MLSQSSPRLAVRFAVPIRRPIRRADSLRAGKTVVRVRPAPAGSGAADINVRSPKQL